MTLTHILLIIIAAGIIITSIQYERKFIQEKKYHKYANEKFTLYDTRITAHKHSVNKTIKEMDEKIEALKKSIKGIINFPQGEG
ncbi:MAG TPA: hypothetical protein ENH82_03500 [bacterium]|nr:hypothetical protein [bacterium]